MARDSLMGFGMRIRVDGREVQGVVFERSLDDDSGGNFQGSSKVLSVRKSDVPAVSFETRIEIGVVPYRVVSATTAEDRCLEIVIAQERVEGEA
jgi:hypothetical protein